MDSGCFRVHWSMSYVYTGFVASVVLAQDFRDAGMQDCCVYRIYAVRGSCGHIDK